jgi:hypothetical protein
MYNCIIVSQGQYVTDKDYSRKVNVNDVYTAMKLGGVNLVSISEFRPLYWGEWYHPTGQLGYFCTKALHQEHWLVSNKDQWGLNECQMKTDVRIDLILIWIIFTTRIQTGDLSGK